jgi:hypothetical protein
MDGGLVALMLCNIVDVSLYARPGSSLEVGGQPCPSQFLDTVAFRGPDLDFLERNSAGEDEDEREGKLYVVKTRQVGPGEISSRKQSGKEKLSAFALKCKAEMEGGHRTSGKIPFFANSGSDALHAMDLIFESILWTEVQSNRDDRRLLNVSHSLQLQVIKTCLETWDANASGTP